MKELMNRELFIERQNSNTNRINSIIKEFDSSIQINWKDDKELVLSNLSGNDVIILINRLNESLFPIAETSKRLNELTIVFKNSYFGSFCLEKYNDEEFREFCELYEVSFN